MRYAQLLSISLKHSYYSDGVCPDFAISPQKDTETTLKNHRCVVKPRVNGINIYIPTDEAKTPIIQFSNGTQLLFNLCLKNPEFSLYTDFSQLPSNENFQLVDTKQDQWFGTNVFATINIQRDFNKIDESAPNIELAFVTKQVRWVYYLVTNQGNNDSDFIITFGGQGLPSFTWKQIAIAESDKISSLLAKQYPKMRRLCFVSEQDIPCGESGLKNIQLSFGQNKIFENLSSPPIRNYYRTNVDNTNQQADAIFTIVKSITNTTLTKV